MQGFFALSELQTARPTPRLPQCGRCGLLDGCKSPKMPVFGDGRRGIMIVGEAPGATEDSTGKPFQGDAGQRLQRDLRRLGIDMERDCWVTNALSCRPGADNKIANPKSIEYCRPLVLKAIETHKPSTIILTGMSPVKSVIGHLWREDLGPLGRWTGFRIPARRWNAWVCPLNHPSWLLRVKDELADKEFFEGLSAACEKPGMPYPDGPPDYDSRILTTIDDGEATRQIAMLCEDSPHIAFDFETTTLKPDGDKAEIVCCSASNGKISVAFPWAGKAKKEMSYWLRSDSPKKTGWNVKFESRWCRKFGINVKGWVWDGMLAAHAIDSRPGITGLKFQAFVRLGVEDYSASVAPHLKSDKGGNAPNKIRQVDLTQLMDYCARDSLFEAIIAKKQAKQLGCQL